MIWKKILYGKKYKGGFMTIKEIKTPQDILTFMNENIQYGWLDINNEKHLGNMKGFRKLYRTMSMDEVLKNGTEKARMVAKENIKKFKEAIGINYFE